MQQPYVPLTMTILPSQPQQRVVQQIPNFNHVPIQPIIIANTSTQPTTILPLPKGIPSNLTAEEREARRYAQQKERNSRYEEKTREYKKVGTLKTEKEKIIRVLLLCYPSLEEMDPVELDNKVSSFIGSLDIA